MLSDRTVFYLTVYNDDGLNNSKNKISFTELRKMFEESFEIKVQEGSVLKYLNFWTARSPIGLNIDKTDHIMEPVKNGSQLEI